MRILLEVKTTLGRSAAVLAVIGIIAKAMGALYRVPLTNTVGAEGMGLYQMVFPVYTVALAFCGGGISSAVSRVVAKYSAHGDELAARRAVKIAVAPLFAVSVVLTAAVIVFRGAISRLQGNVDASLCYLALAPSLLFAGGTAVIRGYFQGKNNMLPSGVSQLIEQSAKLALGLFFARAFSRFGVRQAVAGALVGVTASELLAALYLGARYMLSVRKRRTAGKTVVRSAARPLFEAAADGMIVTDGMLRREIMSLSLPIMLGALVLPLTQVADSALVINLLMRGGVRRAQATALFGLLVGPVGTLINMPTVILSSVSAAFLPALTSDLERGGDGGKMTKSVFEFVMMFLIPVTVAFLLFPQDICRALYGRGLTAEQISVASRLLRVEAAAVFYAGVYQVSATVLQTRGKARRPTVYLAIGGLVKVALTPVLIIAVGIYGGAAATSACYCVAAVLTVRAAYKTTEIGVSVRNAVILPTLFSAVGAAAFFGVGIAAGILGVSALWKTVLCAAAFFVVYAVGMTACGALAVRLPSSGKSRGGRQKSSEKI